MLRSSVTFKKGGYGFSSQGTMFVVPFEGILSSTLKTWVQWDASVAHIFIGSCLVSTQVLVTKVCKPGCLYLF